MVHLLSKLQDCAQDSTAQLSTTHRVSLHAVIAGILQLLTHISTVASLGEHVMEVVERRREVAPMLLPDQLFAGARGADEEEARGAEGRGADEEEARGAEGRGLPTQVGEDLLFHLRERGFVRQSPEPPVMDPTSKRCMFTVRTYEGENFRKLVYLRNFYFGTK